MYLEREREREREREIHVYVHTYNYMTKSSLESSPSKPSDPGHGRSLAPIEGKSLKISDLSMERGGGFTF